MQFSLDEMTQVTATNVSKNKQNHGNDKVHAMYIAWRIEGPNTLLDRFPGDKRAELYYGDPSDTVPGVERVTPHLRPKSFEPPYKMPYEGTGYLLTIEDGAVSESKFELGDTEIGKFAVTPKDGGSVIITFRTQHVGLDRDTMGRICDIDGKQVRITAAPPDLQEGTQPERLTKAQQKAKDKADEAAKNQLSLEPAAAPAAGPDATDIFAAGGEADVAARKALSDRASGKTPRSKAH